MRRGTTPRITIEIEGTDLNIYDDIEVSFKQDMLLLNKFLSRDELEVDLNNNAVIVKLTQEETIKFKPLAVFIQLRFKLKDGSVRASEVLVRKMEEILDESVM